MQERKIKYPLKFYPVLKQTLWGGDRIVPFLSLEGKNDMSGRPYSEMERIGECWAVSGISGSESVVKGGELDGCTLPQLVELYGEALLGKKNALRFGKEFPLLVKFIDAAQDLSVQVHPNDAIAAERHGCSGKTEMWYVVDDHNDAKLISGFKEPVSKEQYRNLSSKQIVESLHEYRISKGDIFYLPAGTVHSIGAGAFIAEIQQSSDITYRIYDFDRKDKNGKYRELHTELAAEAIDFSQNGNCRIDYAEHGGNPGGDAWDSSFKAVECEHFITSLIHFENGQESSRQLSFNYSHLDSFVILTCTEGSCSLLYGADSKMEITRGDAVLLPADLEEILFELRPNTGCKILETHI